MNNKRIKWVPAAICPHCGEAAHVYFCLLDPRYLADPVGFPTSVEATTQKDINEVKS